MIVNMSISSANIPPISGCRLVACQRKAMQYCSRLYDVPENMGHDRDVPLGVIWTHGRVGIRSG